MSRHSETTAMTELTRALEAKPPDVIQEISTDDAMYFDDVGTTDYFHAGRSALQCMRLAMLAAGKEDAGCILDLPCGHGRVLRTLKAAFPEARLTATDIDEDAVDFCAKAFGATPVYSKRDAEDIELDDQFDLIRCG